MKRPSQRDQFFFIPRAYPNVITGAQMRQRIVLLESLETKPGGENQCPARSILPVDLGAAVEVANPSGVNCIGIR